jgi:hypothetical protein
MTRGPIRKTGLGLVLTIGFSWRRRTRSSTSSLDLKMVSVIILIFFCSPWRLLFFAFVLSFVLLIDFLFVVWCWGWDGAGDLDGPDVEPIWEAMPEDNTREEAVWVRHERSLRIKR